MVEVEGLGFRYPSQRGLGPVSFSASGLVGVAGRNGAGKTTLFRALTGQVRGTGAVRVNGEVVDPRRFPWGWAPCDDWFLPRLTGRQNLEYLSWLRVGHDRAWQDWSSWIEELELGPFLERPFQELSTGNRKKVQLVGSLVGHPTVLVWDEPHNGVDLVANAALNRLLGQLVVEGVDVLLSSHLAEILSGLCTRVVLLKNEALAAVVDPPFPDDWVSWL